MGAKRFQFYITVIIIIAMTGCTTYDNYRVTPRGGNKRWVSGTQKTHVNGESCMVDISYEGTRNNMLKFNVKITNISEERLVIKPEDFYLSCTESLPDSSMSSVDKGLEPRSSTEGTSQHEKRENGKIIKSINPEEQIRQLNYRSGGRSFQKDAVIGGTILCCILGGLFAIFADDSDEEECPRKRRRRRREHEDFMDGMADLGSGIIDSEKESYNTDMQRINAERSFWANRVMKKTTLLKDDSINRYVMFRPAGSMSSTPYVEFVLPIGDETLKILFEIHKDSYRKSYDVEAIDEL